MPRLAVVISHPIQHFVPLFARLAQRKEIDLRVFYCCDWGVNQYRDPDFGREFAWDIPLLEGYDHEFLAIRRRPRALSFWEIDNPSVGLRLDEFQPDAVWVHGYGHRTSWRVLSWAQTRAAVLYFGDSELLAPRSLPARVFKRLVLPRFFRRCDGFMTIGDNNEAYYRHYRVPAEKMFRGCFPIDRERFLASANGSATDDRQAVRQRFGIAPDAVVALFVGKLIDIKRPFDLVDAVAVLRDRVPNLQALIVGSGPLEDELRERIRSLHLEERVRMTGFVNQSQMPAVLGAGDMLAMCSEKDPHPLAVSEAMAMGNAVVASDRVGCVGPTDAARPNQNALVYPCGDVAALAARLERLAVDSELRERMRKQSVELSATQDVAVATDAVMRFLEAERTNE